MYQMTTLMNCLDSIIWTVQCAFVPVEASYIIYWAWKLSFRASADTMWLAEIYTRMFHLCRALQAYFYCQVWLNFTAKSLFHVYQTAEKLFWDFSRRNNTTPWGHLELNVLVSLQPSPAYWICCFHNGGICPVECVFYYSRRGSDISTF